MLASEKVPTMIPSTTRLRGSHILAKRTILAALLYMLGQSSALAQDVAAPTFPGGASELSERHGDWTVNCVVRQEGDAARKICAVTQTQTNAQNQTVLSVELHMDGDMVKGAAVLPFGLAVTQPVNLTLDEVEQPDALAFSTCVPQGCIVPLTFTANQSEALRSAKVATFTAPVIQGQPVKLAVPLAGVSKALDRTNELAR